MLKAKNELMVRKFADKYIIVAIGDMSDEMHSLITINSTGLFIFEQLQKGIEYKDLLNSIVKNYDIDENTAKTDLDAFLQKAKQAGILDE